MTHTSTVRRYLWALLIVGTAASVAANVAHAHPGIGPRIMAVAAPIALLAFTHLVGLWGRIRTSGVTYWAILVTVALIAIGAARVSFAAVRDLAESYGYGPLDAALIPLMLDGGLATTALALVVLGRIEAETIQPAAHQLIDDHQVTTGPGHPITESIIVDQTVDLPLIGAGHEGDQPRAGELDPVIIEPHSEVPVCLVEPGADQPDDRTDPRGDHWALAELIAATGRTNQPINVITAVLAARADGKGQKAAGLAAGVAQGTVRTIEKLREEVAA
ncbi:Protein of uncharacterised function (DUF2637) (plasmid) [Tsukamurella tyrosinosolvens]|uniref:DUF2637 domain-containing protein n=1 Tax=Tsukamurella tyrosinosolvens TaxID=57704 RepID=A0A1H4WMF3_TSUTY|nr:DUF2637 domain-containing protein [Tsukamurella tyrosinosolvens]KXO99658.1 hypothetical protein AXK58_00040 [Tsukamurella tyrosinosolvens]SEC93821.1 Protein of unknown function [Tsukamurella tyrosinosolvens]VEH89417.1 Protein of uncharacterised function (DUF2637) [Tsukamurella tyrosinosolvens]